MKLEDLSPWQQKMLKRLAHYPYSGEMPIAGKNQAPHLSACNALVRKKLAWTYHTGCFGATDEGKKLVAEYEKINPPKPKTVTTK